MVQILAGGFAGLALATAILFYGFNIDLLGLNKGSRTATAKNDIGQPVTPVAIPAGDGGTVRPATSTDPKSSTSAKTPQDQEAQPVANSAEQAEPPSAEPAIDAPTDNPMPVEPSSPDTASLEDADESTPATKSEVPTDEQKDKARRRVDEVFKSRMDAAKLPAQKSELAKELLRVATETRNDPAGRFVLYQEAAQLAASAADVETAIMAADAAISDFAGIDPIAVKEPLLPKAATAAGRNKERQAAIGLASLDLAKGAMGTDQLDAAERLLSIAESAARLAAAPALKSQVASARDTLGFLKANRAKYDKMRDLLSREPENPVANQFVGQYLLFGKRQRNGLAYLEKGNDADLKEQAKLELAEGLTASEAYNVAEKWRLLASGAEPPVQRVMRELALAKYRCCESQLTGLERESASQRIKELVTAGVGDAPTVVHETPAAASVASATEGPWREVVRLKGHRVQVTAIAVSPDGTLAASTGGDGVIRVWDAKSWTVKTELTGHMAHRIAFVPNANAILSVGSSDGRLVRWSLTDGKEERATKVLDGEAVGIGALAVDPSGSFAVVGDNKGRVVIVTLSDLTVARSAQEHKDRVHSVAISPNGKRIASASWDRSVILWDADQLRPLHKLVGPAGFGYYDVCFALGGRRVASSSTDGINVWDASEGQLLKSFKVGDGGHPGNDGRVVSLAVLDDGPLCLAGRFDGKVYCVNLATGETNATLPRTDGLGIIEQIAVTADQRMMLLANCCYFDNGFKFRDDPKDQAFVPVWQLTVAEFKRSK